MSVDIVIPHMLRDVVEMDEGNQIAHLSINQLVDHVLEEYGPRRTTPVSTGNAQDSTI